MTEKLKFVLGRVENVTGNGENAGYSFSTLFSILLETKPIIWATYNLLSAKNFNFYRITILLFGPDLSLLASTSLCWTVKA